MSSRLASQRPMPIPGMGAPDMEPNVSHSPIELPTPPDEVALGADSTRRHASGKDSAGVFYPLFARRSSFDKAPSQHAMFAFDDDETDEESGLPDDDATEDEGEPYERRRSYTVPSRSPSPPYSSEYGYEDDEAVTRARSRSRPREDARYAYAGMRAAPHGFPYARNTPLGQPTRPGIRAHTPYATSLPARVDRHARGLSTYEPGWPVEDSKQRAQVQMAAAALDRLSMAADSDEKRAEASELPRSIDESDEVAAIRDRLGGAANCSAFISKLWHLMINPDLYGKYIHWNEGGDTIILSDRRRITLPRSCTVPIRVLHTPVSGEGKRRGSRA